MRTESNPVLATVVSLPPGHQGMGITIPETLKTTVGAWKPPGSCTGAGSGFLCRTGVMWQRGHSKVLSLGLSQTACLGMSSGFLGGPVTSGKSLSLSVWFPHVCVSAVFTEERVSMYTLLDLVLMCTQQKLSVVTGVSVKWCIKGGGQMTMTHCEGSLCTVGMLSHTVDCLGRTEMTGLCTLAPSSPEETVSREDGRLGCVPL